MMMTRAALQSSLQLSVLRRASDWPRVAVPVGGECAAGKAVARLCALVLLAGAALFRAAPQHIAVLMHAEFVWGAA